jgi:tetratricopeptide (TPR) repeat protein
LAAERDERVRGLQDALATYTEAVKLQEALKVSDDRRDAYQRDLRLLLEGRSAAQLEAAFYAKDQPDRRVAHLAGALHDAAQSLLIDDELVPLPHEAYVKLGNALEDHAYYLQDLPLPADTDVTTVLADRIGFTIDDTALAAPGAWQALKFAAADAAFAKALEHAKTDDQGAFAQLYRGRARYRSALSLIRQDRAAAEQSLRAARDDLRDAVSERGIKNPRYRAEAYHWLGEVLELGDEYAEAIKCYESATQLAKEADTPEWPDYQFAWADLLSQQNDTTGGSLDQAYRLAEEVLSQRQALTSEGVRTIELLANCKGRRRDRDQVEFIERQLPATPPTDGAARCSYWRLQHLRSWWAYYRITDRTRYVAERTRAKDVRDGCRACGDPALAAHGDGIYGLWTWKWVRSLGVGAPERPQATQEAFDALAKAVAALQALGELRVYTADYANALAELYKATDAAAPLKDTFRATIQPLRDALIQHAAPTRQLFKEPLFEELLRR